VLLINFSIGSDAGDLQSSIQSQSAFFRHDRPKLAVVFGQQYRHRSHNFSVVSGSPPYDSADVDFRGSEAGLHELHHQKSLEDPERLQSRSVEGPQ
jgi:hypothetical protein